MSTKKATGQGNVTELSEPEKGVVVAAEAIGKTKSLQVATV